MSVFDITTKEKAKIIDGSLVKKARWSIGSVTIALFLTALSLSADIYVAAGALMVYPTAIFLIFMGYRLGYLWLIVFRVFDMSMYLIEDERIPYIVMMFGIIFIAMYFYGLKIEVNRIKMQKSGEMAAEKSHKFRDTMLAVLIFVITTMFGLALTADEGAEEYTDEEGFEEVVVE